MLKNFIEWLYIDAYFIFTNLGMLDLQFSQLHQIFSEMDYPSSFECTNFCNLRKKKPWAGILKQLHVMCFSIGTRKVKQDLFLLETENI